MRYLQSTGADAGKLHVLLHGTFAFHVDDKPPGITAYIPRISHHVYRAGNWLGETDLRPGKKPITYRLRGAKDDGTDKVDTNSNLMIKRVGPPPAAALFATLKFPVPAKITSLFVSEIRRSEFQNSAGLLSNRAMQSVASLQIFTYAIEDEALLRLEAEGDEASHNWEPVFSGDYINLHIFSEEDRLTGLPNNVGDLKSVFTIFGSKLELKSPFASTTTVRNGPLPDGIREEETEHLAARTVRMARLGRLLLQKGEPAQAWYPNEPLGDRVHTCGSGWGD